MIDVHAKENVVNPLFVFVNYIRVNLGGGRRVMEKFFHLVPDEFLEQKLQRLPLRSGAGANSAANSISNLLRRDAESLPDLLPARSNISGVIISRACTRPKACSNAPALSTG